MKYIIHRGLTSNKNKENSYLAIRNAILDKNSSGVEFDIKLTKDNKIVLSHDSIIGINYIENMDYIDIIKYKYLTTLDRILSTNTDKILLIDIKVNNNYKLFGNILLKKINNSNRNIYLMSFNKKIIKYINNKTKYKKGIISFYYKKNKYPITILNYKTISANKLKNIKNKIIFLWTFTNIKEAVNFKNKINDINTPYFIINKEE